MILLTFKTNSVPLDASSVICEPAGIKNSPHQHKKSLILAKKAPLSDKFSIMKSMLNRRLLQPGNRKLGNVYPNYGARVQRYSACKPVIILFLPGY